MNISQCSDLWERYEVFFFDVSGVLLDGRGPLPCVRRCIEALNRSSSKFYWILTNDASRLPEQSRDRFLSYGLEIPTHRILTSGMLLKEYFRQKGLEGSRTLVMGPPDAWEYVRRAGGKVLSWEKPEGAEVLVISNGRGYPVMEWFEKAVNLVFDGLDRDRALTLVLPNPDLVFPLERRKYGLTSGALAKTMTEILSARYAGDPRICFDALGKPNSNLYTMALQKAQNPLRSKVLMLGDQLMTDILGAEKMGLDQALVETGVHDREDVQRLGLKPSWILQNLCF